MAKYRLVWNGDGSLDLSQVSDTQGKPILFPKKGASVTVDEGNVKHPFVKRYVESGLVNAIPLDVKTPPIKATPKSVSVPKVETSKIKEEPLKIEKKDEPKKDIWTSSKNFDELKTPTVLTDENIKKDTETETETEEQEEKTTSKPKGRGRGRRSK